jgi:hypothetical protein
MCQVKRLFWDGDDVVMQLHPREDDYVNCHPCVLHLWRPTGDAIPTPPADLVGPPNARREHEAISIEERLNAARHDGLSRRPQRCASPRPRT